MKFTTLQFRDHSEGSLQSNSKNFSPENHMNGIVCSDIFSVAVWHETCEFVCSRQVLCLTLFESTAVLSLISRSCALCFGNS